MHHVTAIIEISERVAKPKTAGIKSGYSPHHKFDCIDYLVSGFHTYSDQNIHFPGERITAQIVFPSWEYFGARLKVGDKFEIREMERIIGHGVITDITAKPKSDC